MSKFCVALFNAIRKDQDFRIRPCCVFKSKKSIYEIDDYLKSDYMADARKRMIDGQSIPECSVCWQKEKAGLTSLRHIYNQQFLHNKNIPDNIAKKAKTKIIQADIKIGNRCNYACAMCHPGDSSLIFNKYKANLDNKFVQEYSKKNSNFMDAKLNTNYRNTSLQMLDNVLSTTSVRSIKILGGEPLLEQEFLKRLASVPDAHKQKITLWVVTNGSIDLVNTLSKLGKYKAIVVTVSLEGTGKLQEYVRKRSSWQQIESNICKFLEFNNPRWFLGVHHTMQALSLHGLVDLITWCDGLGIKITYQNLTNPDYLSLAITSPEYRRQQMDNVNVQGTNNFQGEDLNLSGDLASYCLQQDYKPELVGKFLKYCKFYESDHNLKLLEVAPELLDSFN